MWFYHEQRFEIAMRLEPDGAAIGCNPIEVGSTPTGLSDLPTADSDYINFGS